MRRRLWWWEVRALNRRAAKEGLPPWPHEKWEAIPSPAEAAQRWAERVNRQGQAWHDAKERGLLVPKPPVGLS